MAGKRASGESSIYQDDKGRWHGYVSMGLKSGGRRDRRHVSGAKRADVVSKVRALEQKRDAGVIEASGQPITVESWLIHWQDTIAERKVRPSTLTRYKQLIKHQIIPGVGHHRLDRLQPEHVEAMYTELLNRNENPLQPATVLQCHRVLSRALKVAMQRGRVARNVCSLVDAPSVEREEVQPLSQDDARKVLAVATGRNSARWSVALALGLRQGEALGLQWDAVDLESATMRIRQALQRRPGVGLVMVQPKSRAGRRTISIPARLVKDLKVHRADQNAERLAAGSEWREHDLVFCQPNGSPIDPTVDHRAGRSLLVNAGVRQVRLHDARHTAASLLLQQGVPARVVMEILGHSQVGLTLGTYSHVAVEVAQEAAQRMNNALWG
jgi:integrase